MSDAYSQRNTLMQALWDWQRHEVVIRSRAS
jgi:hypothetical protein